MAQSNISWHGHSHFDFDADALKQVLRSEGQEVAKISRRLVSRSAISRAGEFAGQQSGLLKKSIKAKVSKPGLLVIITHVLKSNQARYPFILAYGSRKTSLDPRADHMQQAMKQRRAQSTAALRSALHKTILAK